MPTPSIGRIPILAVGPSVDGGRWPARCAEGEVFPITATVFREGHDRVGATAVLVDPDGAEHTRLQMTLTSPGFDTFEALVCADRLGAWSFHVEAWDDPIGTWRHAAEVKIGQGIDTELVFADGAALLREAQASWRSDSPAWHTLDDAIAAMRDTARPDEARLSPALSDHVRDVLDAAPLRRLVTRSDTFVVQVNRKLAAVSSWYEIFPRSVGATRHPETGKWVSGTFQTASRVLPYVADLGFNVVYFPPPHPIGTAFRKGPNNTLEAGPDDPGSPYAIGSAQGGHDAIHPDLGTMDDFAAFVEKARALGLEVALDLALQCSPDHPWVTEHPEWFVKRADGSIAYAENPPKKYQDIYPLHFDTDPEGLANEILRVVRFWIEAGVTLFRVDNPHTKPLQFWEWLIAEVNAEFPDVIFLAEAFTRPAIMRTLAKIGFQQSYTYFTWRNTKKELVDYVTELSTGSHEVHEGLTGTADYMRPNFWPTTPDILTPYVQQGATAHCIRAILAATLSPSWGLYGGYEFIESVPRPGAEEHLSSEKYEYRPRDFAAGLRDGTSIAPLLRTLNRIRRFQPAVTQMRMVRFHETDHDELLAYSYHLPGRFAPNGQDNTVICVVNLNPNEQSAGNVHLDMTALDLADDSAFVVSDQLTGQVFTWRKEFFVRLGGDTPAHVAVVERPHSGRAE